MRQRGLDGPVPAEPSELKRPPTLHGAGGIQTSCSSADGRARASRAGTGEGEHLTVPAAHTLWTRLDGAGGTNGHTASGRGCLLDRAATTGRRRRGPCYNSTHPRHPGCRVCV